MFCSLFTSKWKQRLRWNVCFSVRDKIKATWNGHVCICLIRWWTLNTFFCVCNLTFLDSCILAVLADSAPVVHTLCPVIPKSNSYVISPNWRNPVDFVEQGDAPIWANLGGPMCYQKFFWIIFSIMTYLCIERLMHFDWETRVEKRSISWFRRNVTLSAV